jgi:hypothetical protein
MGSKYIFGIGCFSLLRQAIIAKFFLRILMSLNKKLDTCINNYKCFKIIVHLNHGLFYPKNLNHAMFPAYGIRFFRDIR